MNRLFLLVFGLSLMVVGVYIWFQPNFAIPTRTAGVYIRFPGVTKILFGLSPFLAGTGLFKNSFHPEVRNDPWALGLFTAGAVSMIIAVLLASKY
jgi:ABC-type cobalamin transport system permease subunit